MVRFSCNQVIRVAEHVGYDVQKTACLYDLARMRLRARRGACVCVTEMKELALEACISSHQPKYKEKNRVFKQAITPLIMAVFRRD